jgi:predicted lipoprotein
LIFTLFASGAVLVEEISTSKVVPYTEEKAAAVEKGEAQPKRIKSSAVGNTCQAF